MRRRKLLRKLHELNPYRGVWGVCLREWRRFRADGPQKTLLLAVAPLFAWFFCALYGAGAVQGLPVAVVDNDHSSLSRTLTRSIDATKLMDVVAHVNSLEELKRGVVAGRFAAGIVFPQRMLADAKSSRPAAFQLFCNGASYVASSMILREAQTVARTVNAGIVKNRLMKSGMGEAQAMALVSPIVVDMSNVYNPAMNYVPFLPPGFVFAQLGMMVMLAGAICFARERERNTLDKLRFRANARSFSAMHGKALPYATYIAVLFAVILFILFPLYRIGNVDGIARALPGTILFLAASWWLGSLIGMVAGKVLIAASLSLGIGMPSFLFSGWTFPLPGSPGLYSLIAAALPFPHFMQIWFSTVQKGFGPLSLLSELSILAGMTVLCHFLTRMLLLVFWTPPPQQGARHA
jgi:ABC-2 type transport system permease protein